VSDKKQDRIRHAIEVVGRSAPLANLLGIDLVEARDCYALTSVKIRDEHCNAEARTHGGVLFTLADQAFAVAVSTRGPTSVAMEIKINYFQASQPGDTVFAEATPIDIRNRVSLWNIDITNDRGERIAHAQGLAYHFIRKGTAG
jgi:acyl-CoA thioesterase